MTTQGPDTVTYHDSGTAIDTVRLVFEIETKAVQILELRSEFGMDRAFIDTEIY